MERAINDATLNKAGDIYQYLIALKDCFDLNDGDVLQIEVNGDVSVINKNGGVFQKEVKHHLGKKTLSDRNIDFWKTLANWYEDYDRVKSFSDFILSTTAGNESSSFSNWNNMNKVEKLELIIEIGREIKPREKTFREQYNRIFNDTYDKQRLLHILDKFTIQFAQTSIAGISREFTKYLLPISEEHRDGYIYALLGGILKKVAEYPHKWEVTKKEFEELCITEALARGINGTIKLPNEYAKSVIPDKEKKILEHKEFVEAIREIHYDEEIPTAISEYWRTQMTIIKYFHNNPTYIESLEEYIDDLNQKLKYCKKKEIDAEGKNFNEQIKISKSLYNDVMQWKAEDFGTIIHNRNFFQHGVIHNIVDETDYIWRVGEEKDEHN